MMRYMGAKSRLAPHIDAVLAEVDFDGLLDAFAGTGVIASLIAPDRRVHLNDYLSFICLINKARFCTDIDADCLRSAAIRAVERATEMSAHLENQAQPLLDVEKIALGSSKSNLLVKLFNEIEMDRSQIYPYIRETSLRLSLTRNYSFSYFSLQQTIQLDCLLTSFSGSRWHTPLTAAVLLTMSKISNTTGHFAQFMRPKESNFLRIKKQMNRDGYAEFLQAVDWLIENSKFHPQNTVSKSETTKLFSPQRKLQKNTLIYADPPYTGEQYFRYYHVPEVVLTNKYGNFQGRGYTPSSYPKSPFSSRRSAPLAFKKMIHGAHSAHCPLVISYPENGVLENTVSDLGKIITDTYGRSPKIYELPIAHSTMGGSKGEAKSAAIEYLFVATC